MATATTTMAWPYAQRAAPARSQAHLAARGWLPSMACATVQNRFAALRDRAGELAMRGGSAPACWSAVVAWPPGELFLFSKIVFAEKKSKYNPLFMVVLETIKPDFLSLNFLKPVKSRFRQGYSEGDFVFFFLFIFVEYLKNYSKL